MIDVLYYIVELMKMLCIYVFGFQMQITSKRHRIVGAIIFTIVVGILASVYKLDDVMIIIDIGYVLVVSYLLIKEFTMKRAVITLWSVGIILAIDTLSYVIMKLLCSFCNVAYTEICDLLGSIITLIILTVLFWGIRKNSKVALKEPSVLFCVAFLVASFVNVYILVIIETHFDITNLNYSVVYIMLIVGSLIQMAFIILVSTLKDWHQENERVKEKYLNLQNEHYQYLKEKDKEIRKFRHDMRHHLYVIKEYVCDNKIRELENYLDSICDKIEHVPYYVSVGNEIVDAILNYYYHQFLENNIDFVVNGKMPINCRIDAYDLCTIFSNILSNALEATMQVSEKRIFLTIRYEDDMIFVCERNTFDGVVLIKGNRMQTSKPNTETHGFGLVNIIDSVNKYNGNINYSIEGKECICNIVMENKKVGM